MRNWGFQYFLVNLLNQRLGKGIVMHLIDQIERLCNDKFLRNFDSFLFYISGRDSALSAALNPSSFRIFQESSKGAPADTNSLLNNSDLCLVLTDSRTAGRIGMFGEVEGLHGERLRRDSFWTNKPNRFFGFGIIKGAGKSITAETDEYAGSWRTIFFLEQSHPVVSDYLIALRMIEQMFLEGPNAYIKTVDNDCEFILSIVRKYWGRDVRSELLPALMQYLFVNDIVYCQHLGIPVVPNLQGASAN